MRLGLEQDIWLSTDNSNRKHRSTREKGSEELMTPSPPDCDTKHVRSESVNDNPLEEPTANDSDAPNTPWFDYRFEIWRHGTMGAVMGYVKKDYLLLMYGLVEHVKYNVISVYTKSLVIR
ncbi:hypothetical protein F5883DRAFT_639653 [Diaporthe sp. PMI_573]|nr:hypothetical protein F5883DRAFT_639653 [Diaporthaceae sp. PMI_573]